MTRGGIGAGAALLLWACAAQPVQAQDRVIDRAGFYLGLNVVIGGVSALAQSVLHPGGPPAGTALLGGAAGGAVLWGGQRLVGTGEPALRLPGVQLAAVGANMARNAGRGGSVLSDLVLPLYPFDVRLRPGSEDAFSVRVSAVGALALADALTDLDRHQAGLDWKESLLTGAPVFRSSSSYIYPFGPERPAECRHGDGCPSAAAGIHRHGISWYTTGGRTASASRRILTHEILHLTQVHRDALMHAVPMSDAVLAHLGGPFDRLRGVFVVDAYLPLTGLNSLLAATGHAHGHRFYEREVEALLAR